MLEIKIRHEISETEEEIYFFMYYGSLIDYKGIYFSNRDSKDDIWGYDYHDYLIYKFSDEIDKINSMYGDGVISPQEYDEKINNIFAPKHTKTIHGKTRLTGTFGGNHEYTPKIEPVKLKEMIIKKITDMLENSKLRL